MRGQQSISGIVTITESSLNLQGKRSEHAELKDFDKKK
jgi:hypothetical protein